MTLLGLVATLGAWSWRHAAGEDEHRAGPSAGRFLAGAAQCLRRPSFRALFVSSTLFHLGISMSAALSIHFLTTTPVTDRVALGAFQVAFYVAGLAGVGFWLNLSRGMEKHQLYLAGTVATAAAIFGVFALVGEDRLLGIGNVRALVVGHALVGFFASTLWFVPPPR